MFQLKNILLILCALLSVQAGAQRSGAKSAHDSIEFIKAKMRAHGEVQSAAYSYSGKVSMQYHGFLYLLESLSQEELYALTYDSIACIRVYAYAGLLYNRSLKVKEVKTRLQTDSTAIKAFIGCNYGNSTVARCTSDIARIYERKTVNYFLKKDRVQLEAWRERLFDDW